MAEEKWVDLTENLESILHPLDMLPTTNNKS